MFNRYRILAAYVFAIPLALILGFLAASPDELTFMLIGMLLFFLALPLFINWHHALLIVFWNSAFTAAFLPGQPAFWLFFAALSFGISLLGHVMGRRPFLPVPEMTRPLLFLAAVVLCTAWYRGGVGVRSLGGGAFGGKNYVLLLGAIIGYFALTAGQIPILKSRRMAGLFFLSWTTYVLSNLAYTLGPGFFFLYYLVPSGYAMDQAASDYGLTSSDRIQGLARPAPVFCAFCWRATASAGFLTWPNPGGWSCCASPLGQVSSPDFAPSSCCSFLFSPANSISRDCCAPDCFRSLLGLRFSVVCRSCSMPAECRWPCSAP